MTKTREDDGETSTAKFKPAKMKVDEELPEPSIDEEENKPKRKKKKQKKKKDTIDVTIETIGEHPDKISPLIGYFPSGFDPLKVDPTKPKLEEEVGSPEPPPQHRVRVFRHEKRTSRLELVVSPNGSPVDFVGTNYTGEATAGQVCTYALGVLDKETRTLKIVPIASNKIFRMEPRVRGSDLSESEPSNMLVKVLTAEEKKEKKDDQLRDVTRMYGSKAAMNRDKKLAALQQKDDPRSKKDLDKKIEVIEINKEALESAHTYNSLNIPPHDISATTPQMAYPLDKIIFKGEWNYLLDIFELSQVGEKVAADEYPSFVRNRVYKLEETEDDVERKTLACILSYITHLVKFKEKRSIDGVSSSKNSRIPNILFNKFMAMFTDTESKKLSDDKRDLLISYILVLTLFADDFQTDPSDIATDLRMGTTTLRQHFEHLGCKLVRSGKLSLATLPVPLQFPKPRVKRGR